MTKRKLQSQSITLPEFHQNLKDEIKALVEDYTNGSMVLEFALLRVARLVVEELYLGKKIQDEVSGDEIIFTEQEQLVKYISQLLNISRATIMSRLSGYKWLIRGLGMTYKQSFRVMLECPGVVRKIGDVAQLDRFTGEIKSLNLDKAIALVSMSKDEDFIKKIQDDGIPIEDKIKGVVPALKQKVLELAELGSRQEASKGWDEAVARNTVYFRHNGDGGLIARCTERVIDSKTGEVSISREFERKWMPDKKVPDWVIAKLYGRVNAIEER